MTVTTARMSNVIRVTILNSFNMKKSTHLRTLLSSLKKTLSKARVTGDININNLYMLNVIDDIKYNLCLDLSHEQHVKLTELYSEIMFSDKDICNGITLEDLMTIRDSRFITKPVDPGTIVDVNVFYWKSQISETDSQIINTIENDTYDNSNVVTTSELTTGFELTSNNIGKLVILFTNSNNTVNIYDILNNDVSSQFNTYNTSKGLCVISKNIFINEPLTLKITINHE